MLLNGPSAVTRKALMLLKKGGTSALKMDSLSHLPFKKGQCFPIKVCTTKHANSQMNSEKKAQAVC